MSITKTLPNTKFDVDHVLELANHISACCRIMSTHNNLAEQNGSNLSELFVVIFNMADKIHEQVSDCYSQF